MKKSPKYRQWFTYFACYNLLFLILQLGFIFQKSGSFIHAIALPPTVYPWLFLTLLIHFILYFILSLLQTSLMWGLAQRYLSQSSLERWHLRIWSLSVCTLLTANVHFFPLSRFSRLFLPEFPTYLLLGLFTFSLGILSILMLNTLFFASKKHPKTVSTACLCILSLFIGVNFTSSTRNHEAASLIEKPNIIIIGIDSLSPNKVNANDMPTIAHFIKHSVSFKETISPLAHTFPAWSSILTGLYPKHHQARYNLIPLNTVKSSNSIAWTLQRLGYETIFATDDRQFNNMESEFGFKRIIGPKVGVNDILLSNLNDFPLSNLLVNLRVSDWLFPYNYINRASPFTYYPRTFDKALHRLLKPSNPMSPVFLAVHFTMPHWPYAWAQSSFVQVSYDSNNIKKQGQLYTKALQQVDQQVNRFLQTLEEYGYLKNSLVILLSDHGETLYEQGSRQTNLHSYQGLSTSKFADYLQRKTSTGLETSMGHGSDLLSPNQYHCVLAFKIYQQNHLRITPKVINTRVALLDIAPTIHEFLKTPNPFMVDGHSLLKAIEQEHFVLPNRSFIMESGMLPNQFISAEKAEMLGKEFFTIDPYKGTLQLKKNKISKLDSDKLYGLIDGDWVLALYPDDAEYIPVILHLSDGKWTDLLNTKFAKNSPAKHMLSQLEHFYSKRFKTASALNKKYH